MARPTDGAAEWATDANYPAGPEPEAGTPTKAAYTTGQAAHGYRPDQIPTAQEENKFKNLVARWTAYLKDITEPKWKWLSCSAGTIIPSNAPHGTMTIGASAGFFGEVGQTNYVSKEVDLPIGARLLGVGIRFRHVAGEANGGVIGAVSLYKHDAPADGTNAANPPTLLAANPPAAVNPAANTLEVLGNNAAGAKWETKTVNLDVSDLTKVVIADKVSYTVVGMCSGATQIESIGLRYQLDS